MLVDHEWAKAKNIGEPLNDRYPNGVSSVTPDGQSILVINAYNGIYVGSEASISHQKMRDGRTLKKFISKNSIIL